MKLTPLDIHHKEFTHSLRGYNEAEVDEFLDQVADELERLFKENIDLNERLEATEERVKSYQDMERTLHNTLVSAQKSADEILAKAQHEADVVLKDAEVKAKEIIHNALTQKQKAAADLMRIKQAEEEFRSRFRALLEDHQRGLGEIELPSDIQVLTAETADETIGDVDVVAPAAPAPAPAPEPAPSEPTGDTQPIEPPSSGFVAGIQLGEVGAEVPAVVEEPVFEDPAEFKLDFGSLGERDEDIDIEEID